MLRRLALLVAVVVLTAVASVTATVLLRPMPEPCFSQQEQARIRVGAADTLKQLQDEQQRERVHNIICLIEFEQNQDTQALRECLDATR